MTEERHRGTSPRLVTIAFFVVAPIWAASVISQLVGIVTNAPTGVNEVFTAVVMGLLAKQQQSPDKKQEDSDE